MIKKFLTLLLLSLCPTTVTATQSQYQWTVIGAGLSGITALMTLIDSGIDPESIMWIDPEFAMGRLGKYYRHVPSNTPIKQLKNFIHSIPFLESFSSHSKSLLLGQPAGEYPLLEMIVNPLIEATQKLRCQVHSLQDTVLAINSTATHEWNVECINDSITSHKVIIAIGAHPKRLDYPLQEIPSDEALDKEKLAQYINHHDCIAVFGGMHSALLVLKHLTELGVQQIYNFYTTHYFFRTPGAESLEGHTKAWVKNVLEGNPPRNLKRLKNTQENIDSYLPLCNKVIYAIGYERNTLLINGSDEWNPKCDPGIIYPHLYVIGFACPHTVMHRSGQKVAINGFNTYLGYARRLIPLWKSE